VASLGISLANAPSLVAAAAAVVATAVVNADRWSATIAMRRAICPGSALRAREVAAAAAAVAAAIATIAASRGICLVIAPNRGREAAAEAVVETAITADNQVICPGIARSRGKAVAIAAVIATAFNATVARDMAICRVNAPSEF